MTNAHGRSVIETNKNNICIVVNTCVFIYFQGIFFTETQHKLSVLKHKRFIFI